MATTITAAIILAVYLANALGLLDKLGLKKGSAADAAGEIEIRDKIIERVSSERDRALATAAKLEHERSNQPVLELVSTVARICEQTLEKLASFNGTLRHIEDGLGNTCSGLHDATEGMKVLTGLVAELHDLPVKPPPPKESP